MNRQPWSAVVLMYHRVVHAIPDTYGLCLTPERFRDHMAMLRRDFVPLPLTDITTHLADGTLPAGVVAITLDDGYLDNLTTASPLLQENEIPATFFIPTERLSERSEFWWDTVERVLMSEYQVPDRLDLSDLGGAIYKTQTAADRNIAQIAVSEYIRGLAADFRDVVLDRIVTWAAIDVSPRETHRRMVTDEVRELAGRPGHTIGAHTVHHLSLPTLPAGMQRYEMNDSKAVLEDIVGREVATVSYPYGRYDATTIALAAELFEIAVTVQPAAVTVATPPRALPRIDANPFTAQQLAERLRSALLAA
jgi:peptidoglycan/xylan/chitin deacetylase (PgdA/CDA1 family)